MDILGYICNFHFQEVQFDSSLLPYAEDVLPQDEKVRPEWFVVTAIVVYACISDGALQY